MGKTTRWLKSVLGMKREKERGKEQNPPVLHDRKRWSFSRSGKDVDSNSQIPFNAGKDFPSTDSAWLTSLEKTQNKHALAVAAATAAAADAAMVAAQAAAAVVRLTSNARAAFFGGGKDMWAAVKIQTVFRGYLSRKALRALKGLVRLQALVRGYLVRKRAAATLHSMQALIRAQSAVRSQRLRRSFDKENRYYPENRHWKSIERFDEPRSEFHSKRLPTSIDTNAYEDNPKIVEIDTFKTRSRSHSHRFNVALSECGDDLPYQTIASPLPRAVPARTSLHHYQNPNDFEWFFAGGDECRFASAHNTPRFANLSDAPTTPAKSVCGDGCFRPYSNFPNYMTNTQSSKAKLRSNSAPKQRPESGAKKRLSLNEIMAARNSMSGVRMNRSCYQVHECLNI
ncbi:IQ-domain 26 [Hibiscus trionum]|uniref:IQ-domain 26 n=1 Tax=Hibiscus trionum TaxID=183268 RepID=A0A9W7HZW5_HIBTR|nr:IQ-domain 26 [Hibiscus trionum]